MPRDIDPPASPEPTRSSSPARAAIHDTTLITQVIGAKERRHDATLEHLRAADRRLDATTQAAALRASSPARVADLVAQGKRALMIGAAVAVVILAMGCAVRLAQRAPAPASPVATAAPAPGLPSAGLPSPGLPSAGAAIAGRPGTVIPAERNDIIVSNYSIFTETKRRTGTTEFLIQAGHNFPDERAATFRRAWCYIEHRVDGVSFSLDLGTLVPGQPPVQTPSPVSAGTRRAMGLSEADVGTLFRSCPWLESKAAAVPAPAAYKFAGDVTDESVDRLIAAVRGGARSIEIASNGGSLDAALRGFDVLNAAGVSTQAVGDCASACVLLFAAGRERRLGAGGRIGVHQWSTEDGVANAADAQLTSVAILERFIKAGISPEIYLVASATLPEAVRYLGPQELRDWKVTTG